MGKGFKDSRGHFHPTGKKMKYKVEKSDGSAEGVFSTIDPAISFAKKHKVKEILNTETGNTTIVDGIKLG